MTVVNYAPFKDISVERDLGNSIVEPDAPISTPAYFRDDFSELPYLPGLCQQFSGSALHLHSLPLANVSENCWARSS